MNTFALLMAGLLLFCNLVKSTCNKFSINAYRDGKCPFNSEDGVICYSWGRCQQSAHPYWIWDKLVILHASSYTLTHGFIGSLSQHMQGGWVCLSMFEPEMWSPIPHCPAVLGCVYLRPILFLLSPTTLSVLWAVCCGAVTSLSPRCHPAGAGFRRA